MFGHKNREGGHSWADSDRVENPTFAQGARVSGVHDGSVFWGTVTETRLALTGAEKVRVEFDPDSAAAIELQQGHGFFHPGELRVW